MKYTDVVKTAPKAVMSHVDKNGAAYTLFNTDNMQDTGLYQLIIPVSRFDEAKLLPVEKTIYFSRYIREAIEEGKLVSLRP